MNVQELEAEVKALKEKLANVESIQEIEKLQKIYGYYLDAANYDDIIDLFSEKTESIQVGGLGIHLGKQGVIRLMKDYYGKIPKGPGRLAHHLQLQGVVNIDPGGTTAKGRWYCLMIQAGMVDGVRKAIWGHATYENKYVKENGKWLFTKVLYSPVFRSPYEDGWVKTPTVRTERSISGQDVLKPDMPSVEVHPYPEDYTLPFHYKNPVSGR